MLQGIMIHLLKNILKNAKIKKGRDKMKDKDIKNQIEDMSARVEKVKDLSVLLAEHFKDENFVNHRMRVKEGKYKDRVDELISELGIFRQNFEEYGTLMFEIIDKLSVIQDDLDKIAEEL